MFVSNADFNLPAQITEYVDKHIYTWLFQNGAPNFDGIIRLPGRLLNIIMYGAFDNVTASYFYLIISYLILAVSFWVFLKYFLKSKSNLVNIALTIAYTFNPAFLGNTSKVGLVAAAGLVPLCLVLTKYFVTTKNFLYLFLLILCLNYSLVHPFTFFINVLFTVGYLFYLLSKQHRRIREYLPKLFLAGILAILLHAYALLPIISVGSVNKDVLSQTIAQEATDYTNLIEIANAGSSVNALTFSKDAFIDYEFYPENIQFIYIIATLGFYFIAFGSFILLKHRISKKDSLIFLSSSFGLLTFIFLTSGHEIANKIISTIVNLPAGWMFRSPLKWQMYLPIFLFTMIAIVSRYMTKKTRIVIVTLLVGLTVVQSWYLVGEIYNNLIKPRAISTFQSLNTIPSESRLLYLSGSECTTYLNQNANELNELNQIFASKYVQVKRASQSQIQLINLGDYEYILICEEDGEGIDKTNLGVVKIDSFDDGGVTLYKNDVKQKSVNSLKNLYLIENISQINSKSNFVIDNLKDDFNYTTTNSELVTKKLVQIFEEIDPNNISNNEIKTSIEINPNNVNKLYSGSLDAYFTIENNNIVISDTLNSNQQILEKEVPYTVNSTKEILDITLRGTAPNAFKNLINNNNFEEGAWNETVDDCFNYDQYPDVGMEVIDTELGKSLQLYSSNHIACTTKSYDVHKMEYLYLSFKFKSLENKVAGVSLRFSGSENSSKFFTARQTPQSNDWTTYSSIINVPVGTKNISVTLYGYPDSSGQRAFTTYDDIHMFEIPTILNDLYIVSEVEPEYSVIDIEQNLINPTHQTFEIENTNGKLLVKANDAYDTRWMLGLNLDSQHESIKSIALNTYTRGWVIDVDKLCNDNSLCTQNSDGTYNITLHQTYKPQKYFTYGLYISGFTLFALFVYNVVKTIKRKYKKRVPVLYHS